MKQFIKYFITSALIFTIVLTPIFGVVDNIGDIRIFTGEQVLAEELPTLVEENSPFFEEFKDSKRVNILLLGVNGNLTDTIVLASYDMKNQSVDLISIPRDTYSPHKKNSSAAEKKINASYHDEKAVGTARAVSELLMGMPINYYIVLSYEGVEKIVDSLGGVPMDITFHMKYKDPYDTPPLIIDIPKGYTVLDGETAVKFLRFRKTNAGSGYHGYPEGDIGRIKAQQTFMKSAFKQAMGLKLPSVISTVLKNVESDLTIKAATKIAAKATGLSGESIQTFLLPGEAGTAEGGLSFYFADSEKIQEMITTIYSADENENDNTSSENE